jgi:hypothetical protein
LLGVVGALLSFIFFIQRQQLEEAKLIKELISEFNKRYDELNEDLNSVVRPENRKRELEATEVNTLYNNFNLCGEEYLFYKRGYIYPEVWSAWVKGLDVYFEDARVKELWNQEAETESYYDQNSDSTFCAPLCVPTDRQEYR